MPPDSKRPTSATRGTKCLSSNSRLPHPFTKFLPLHDLTMSAMDVFWAAPPVTRYVSPTPCYLRRLSDADYRTITAATVVTSLLVYIGILDGRRIILWWPWVFKAMPPQLWRLFSSFLLTGPQLGIIMDPYFRKLTAFTSFKTLH